MVCGDFNEILYSFEKKGGVPREEGKMESFRAILDNCQLENLGFSGPWFMWERGRLWENNIMEGLDRGVANSAWWGLFPKFHI